MSEAQAATGPVIEQRTIAPVPAAERHGKVRDLFTIWFGSNVMLLTVVTGALATMVYGLSLGWAALAIIIGNLFGAVFMALHSAQGPQLGVPQTCPGSSAGRRLPALLRRRAAGLGTRTVVTPEGQVEVPVVETA